MAELETTSRENPEDGVYPSYAAFWNQLTNYLRQLLHALLLAGPQGLGKNELARGARATDGELSP